MSESQHAHFLAYLGHDLRNYMGAITGYGRLVMRKAELPPKQQDNMRKLLDSAEELYDLLECAVDLAKLESGCLLLQPDDVDLPSLLTAVVERARPKAEIKGLNLLLQCQGLPSLVSVDQWRLQQVLEALIDNAIRYTEQGTVECTVTYQQDIFHFLIADTGPGIAPARIEAITQGLVPVPDAEGVGLGLAFCRAMLVLMDSTLQFENQSSGLRCRFSLAFPVIAHSAAALSATSQRAAPQAPYPLPSVEHLQVLSELALHGDIKNILERAILLREDFPEFAGELAGLAKTFQINKLGELLNALRNTSDG